MADEDEKARQEKVAAARKRVEQLKKKKGKSGSSKKNKEEAAEPAAAEPAPPENDEASPEQPEAENEKATEAAEEEKADDASTTPSLAAQSKMRSASFRAGASPGPLSPGIDGESAPDIYRKHVARIEELETENKRLAKESTDAEKRWKKAEEELADLREADNEATDKVDADGLDKLRNELASLQRQNTQLQQQVSKGGHSHRQSISATSTPPHVQAQLDSKSEMIEQMEMEISRLKTQAERRASGAESDKDQVAALEEKLARAESAAGKAQRELQDVKKNLERTSEKAVREGSERSSAETRVKTLEHEIQEAKSAEEQAFKKVESLEKKVTTLTTLHKEQDSRLQALRKEKEQAEKDVKELQTKVESLESENVKLRSRKSAEGGGGLDDEGVDELENEDRVRLEKKIRSLEAEVHELRSGAWIQRRREMEASSPGFQDVDLSSNPLGSSHKKTNAAGGISDFFTSGLNALAGNSNDELLEDDDMDFDEDAFRKAHEQEAMNRIERVREIKRSLKSWEGWRLDIVDTRRGGGEGIGDIFDI